MSRQTLTTLRLPDDVNIDSLSDENSSGLDNSEGRRFNEGSLEVSFNADHLSNNNDEKIDSCGPNHTPNTNQTQ